MILLAAVAVLSPTVAVYVVLVRWLALWRRLTLESAKG